MKLTKKEFEKILKDKVVSECGVTLDVASAEQIYRCMAMIVRQIMSDRQKQFQAKTLGEGKKQVYYLCMEFLMGRSLRTSLFNLGLNEVAEQVLADADIKIDTIYEQEPDAGLGNGGLGRLAACYLDGMATDCIPGTGYSILYEYGIFKQKIVDGWQQETADNWLPGGQVWIKSHPDQAQEIRFDGQAIETWEGGFHHVKYENYNSVIAVPNDMYVAGYGTQGVSKLRLWQAKAPSFDMSSFNAGNYNTAISQSASAELISKILYPNDNHTEGKILRLRRLFTSRHGVRRAFYWGLELFFGGRGFITGHVSPAHLKLDLPEDWTDPATGEERHGGAFALLKDAQHRCELFMTAALGHWMGKLDEEILEKTLGSMSYITGTETEQSKSQQAPDAEQAGETA